MGYSFDLSLFENTAHSPSIYQLERHLGPVADGLIDFCIPANPYFPPQEVFDNLKQHLEKVLRFYPSSGGAIRELAASLLKIHPETLVVANGSTELITWIDRLYVSESIATSIPTFGRWTDQPRETGKT